MRTSALLVALLACATAFAEGAAASACDGVICGLGACKEVPPLIPIPSNASVYRCDCYPGWGNLVPFLPCFIPECPLGGLSCYVPTFKFPPLGSNLTLHPCEGMDCGPGTCVEEQGKPLRCHCNPGTVNLLGNPSFPCTNKDCVLDQNGCSVPNPPPSPPSPGNDNHSSGATPPSSTRGNSSSSLGSVCLHDLLVVAVLAALHVVV